MIFWLIIFFPIFSWGSLDIPTNLDSQDRQEALEIIGLGTSSKFLSNAYPLGGYSGLEVSLSYEAIDVSRISELGSTSPNLNTLHYPKFNVGKGIYNNSDIFFHFIPFNETAGLSEYGFTFRWSFYEALFLPINFSLITHANSANISNKVVTRNLGADVMAGLTFEDFSFFLGLGWVKSTGDFTGGTNGVTVPLDPNDNSTRPTETTTVDNTHFMMGGSYNFEPFFLGLSMDYYLNPVYNLKVGFLF